MKEASSSIVERLKTLLEDYMQTIIASSIAFIITLQGSGDWLIVPMRFFSYLGTEDFFFLVLPLIYWSIDPALGLRVAFILTTSNFFNYIGKLIFMAPRPYWVSSHVRALWTETTFGIPSGHAQNAATIWGIIAAYSKRKWIWVAAILLIFLIGFSRIYLGSHFPHDVIFGWLLGAVIVWAFMSFWKPVGAWVGNKTLGQQMSIISMVAVILIVVGLGMVSLRSSYQLPDNWLNNALLAGTEELHPIDANDTFTIAGSFFGLAMGAAWIMSLGGYQATGPVWKRAIRYVIGLVGVLILWMGLGAIFPRGDGALIYTLRFIRYTLIGLWVTGGAPWVFMKFKLAPRVRALLQSDIIATN